MSEISVKNITKTFGKQTVLKNVNIECSAGNIYGLIGRNGSGKTILMKCIIGLMNPDKGEVVVKGRRIGKDIDFAEDIGFIIEQPGFLLHEPAITNLKYLASIKRKIGIERIKECISAVGLDPGSRKKVGKFSMGMRQRLGIAQAIMENPSILILDEPMNGLDNQGVQEIRKLLLELRENNKTILIANHNKDDIDYLCNEVYEMDNGKIVQKK